MELQNDYFLLRHGLSLANAAGIIVSRLDHGTLELYGLNDEGKLQAEAAG